MKNKKRSKVGSLCNMLEVGGVEYEINTDFRDCLELIMILEDESIPDVEKAAEILATLYGEEHLEKITNVNEAISKAIWFLNCGKEIIDDGRSHTPLMDWEQDEQLIFSGISAAVGRDVRMDENCHYWAFMSYFMAMGECTFTFVQSIRNKLSKHIKLEKWEQDFYRQNRHIVDIKKDLDKREEMFKLVFGVGNQMEA